MELRTIATDGAPKAIGPYSQAVAAGELIFCAGQVALDPASGDSVTGDVRAQTERVLENLTAVLAAAGSDLRHVVKTTVYLTDFNDFAAMNEVYAARFGDIVRRARRSACPRCQRVCAWRSNASRSAASRRSPAAPAPGDVDRARPVGRRPGGPRVRDRARAVRDLRTEPRHPMSGDAPIRVVGTAVTSITASRRSFALSPGSIPTGCGRSANAA